MSLDFQDSTDPIEVKSITMTIVGPPGVGKTSLASTAQSILLDFDAGAHRTAYRAPRLLVQSWADALLVHDHPKVTTAPVVVVDTIGKVADLCGLAVISEGAKGTVHQGALTLQGYGVVKARMLPWLARFRGKDLVLLSHQREEKKKDELIVRPDILGATLQEVLRSSEMIGYLSISGGLAVRQRFLDFDPTEDRLGKNSAGLPPVTVPDLSKGNKTFLGDLIAQTKAALTTKTQASADAESQVADWKSAISTLTTPSEFQETLAKIEAITSTPVASQAKVLLLTRMKAVGLSFDKTSKTFVEKVPA